MPKLVYLEPDEEITDVIDKISKVDEESVSLVIPRGSTLANSIVNLKLLSKCGKELGKEVNLVTSDKIAKNLASQIGLSVFGSINEAKAGTPETKEAPTLRPQASEVGVPTEDVGKIGEVDGVKVYQYDRDAEEAKEVPEALAPEPVVKSEEPEIIEAVKDADSTTQIDTQIDTDKELGKLEVEKPAEGYESIKKPMHARDHEIMGRFHGGKEPLFDKVRFAKKRRKKIIAVIASAAAVVILASLYFVLPKAKVTISAASEPFNFSADITISKDATSKDSSTMTIPGKLVSKEEELEKPFAASGSKNIGEKAKGKITVYNNWGEDLISLPAGTKFSGGGAEFVSTSAATIPGARNFDRDSNNYQTLGTVDVNVEATVVGDQSNIGPADFTIASIPKIQQKYIYGKSASAMAGGSNKIVKVVADKDLTEAKASTGKELKDSIVNKINSELLENEKLLDLAISPTITSESSSSKAGDQVDNFNYKIKLKVEAVVFLENDFRDILLENARSKLAEGKEIVSATPDFDERGDVADESNKDQGVTYEVKSSDVAKGQMVLKGIFNGYIADKYDVDALKDEIKGKTIKTATNKLTSHNGVLSANITTWPTFMRSLPFIEKRITIEFNYGSTSLTTGGSGG